VGTLVEDPIILAVETRVDEVLGAAVEVEGGVDVVVNNDGFAEDSGDVVFWVMLK
jgi:hypothetical protein